MRKLEQYAEFTADYFLINEGRLFRKLANGGIKEITTLDRDRLLVQFAGELYRALDIAWVLHHGYFPRREIISLDGDPQNMHVTNVVPVRTRRHRFYALSVLGGFTHKLSKSKFPTEAACAEDWRLCVNHMYRSELNIVLTEDAEDLAILKALIGRPKPANFPPTAKPRLRRAIKGSRPSLDHVWHKATQQWVKVPPACCVADDIQVRAGYVLQGFSEFAYDSATNSVKPVK